MKDSYDNEKQNRCIHLIHFHFNGAGTIFSVIKYMSAS